MRYINIANFTIDDGWQRKADAALAEARNKATQQERADWINSKSGIWAELKPKLEGFSNGKCWYCEAREKRSDRNVDHYRPKNNVRDSNPPHSGYWWLAFDYTNFRLSCTFCNQIRKDRATGETGGKGDFFPLHDESKRVFPRYDDVKQAFDNSLFRRENPLLLDPCKLSDIALLDYGDNGRVKPKFGEGEKPLAFRRADESIKCYNLNEKEIVEARQAIYAKINELVADGDFFFEDSFNGDPNADYGLERVIFTLAEMGSKKAEFSEFAKAIIAGERAKDRRWMDAIYSVIDSLEGI